MRHRRRVLGQRLGRAERDGELDYLQRVEKRKGLGFAALDVDRNERARTAVLPLVDVEFRIARLEQSEETHRAHLRVLEEKFRTALRVARGGLGANLQRLERAREQPRGVRVRHAAETVAQAAERLEQREVVRERDATDDVGVAADELRCRVEHDVRAEFCGLAIDRPGHRVVDENEDRATGGRRVTRGEFFHRGDVGQAVVRIGRALDEDRARRRAEHLGRLGRRRDARGDEMALDAEAREEAAHERLGAAIERHAHDDLVAGIVRGEQRGADGRHAAGEAARALHAFPERHAVLEDFEIGVVEARVDEPGLVLARRGAALAAHPREEFLAVLRLLEGERRRQEHRRLDGTLAEERVEPVAQGVGFGMQAGDFFGGELGHETANIYDTAAGRKE